MNLDVLKYGFGNLAATVDPLGNRTARGYDLVSRLTSLTDPNGRTTGYTYDSLNRVTQITDPAQGVTGFTYDANGNLLTVTDAKGQITTYTYDNMDHLATRRDPLSRQESYSYDLTGNLTRFTDRKGQVSQFYYDALNRRIESDYADGSATTFTYDSVSRLLQVFDSNSGLIQMGYDDLDRLTQEMTLQGVVDYSYDAIGRRTSMNANGLAPVNYQYDNASRLTQVAQGPIAVGLGYDNAGRRTSLTYPNGTGTNYFYDNASHLSEIIHQGPSGVIEDLLYTYDAAGNRISFDRTNSQAALPQEVQAAYNAANQMTHFNTDTLTYDANGNLTFDGTTSYTWDARNRLSAMSSANVSASFIYDALGRRVSKTINGATAQYLYDGNDIVAEIQYGAISATYLRSLNIDEPFLRSSSIAEYYHTDALGSALALTDQSGLMETTYTYDPFGSTTITGISTNPLQYTGRENDGTGMYYHRARYYKPTLQRFMSEDPIKYFGGDLNLYVYVLNKPTTLTDPTGEFINLSTAVIGGLTGGFIGALRAHVAGCDVLAGALQGAAVGTVAGFTFGLGTPLLTAAGTVGLAAFDVSLVSQNLSNLLSGRKQSPLEVIGNAANAGILTTGVSFATGGLGRLFGDIGAEVSPGFGSFASRFASSGMSAQVAIIQGGIQSQGGRCR